MDRESEWRRSRATLMTSSLIVMMGALIFGFSYLVCGGLSLYVMAVVGFFTVVGFLQYFLWGRRLSEEVAGEREEDERRRRAEGEMLPEEEEPYDYYRH